jgi:hypothetical protein
MLKLNSYDVVLETDYAGGTEKNHLAPRAARLRGEINRLNILCWFG